MASLDSFPDEIIRVVLNFVSPEDNLASVQPLSRRFNHLAEEPLLWRHYCCCTWRHWHPDHKFGDKLAARASSVDWKSLWLWRQRNRVEVARLFDGMLSTRVGQLKSFEQICLKGYDAKDFLLEQCRTDDSAEDVLARRYDEPVVDGPLLSSLLSDPGLFAGSLIDAPLLDTTGTRF
jgi:F-box protein 21